MHKAIVKYSEVNLRLVKKRSHIERACPERRRREMRLCFSIHQRNSVLQILVIGRKKFSLAILAFVLFSSHIMSQTSRTGILNFGLGLSQGFMLKYDSRPVFADGFAEYYADEHISIKGSCTLLVADRVENGILKNYSGISFGAFRHFSIGISDLSIGIQPGVVLERPNLLYANWNPELQVTPSLMLSATYNLFFSRFFHFYLSVSQCNSFYRGTRYGSVNTSWIGFTGGLGYHFRMKK
ncbi:MAG: hypothetical protein CVU11_15140 [Bacteroidetes bacterium HGW-Bacteroidetes-6]|jgi:hypothetical protein|nr:MAG: hypothetical protein CVU11_15140 [Bacteroidetes bacterium HGW-Bacteroidetes-6]